MRKWKWWILVLAVLIVAGVAVGIIREQRKASDSKLNVAQKSALQDALQVTEQTHSNLDDAIVAARTIDIDAFCPLRP